MIKELSVVFYEIESMAPELLISGKLSRLLDCQEYATIKF
jgi:hypothetical protein